VAHLNGLDLGRKRLSHKDRLIKVLEGDFLRSLTLFGQISGKYHHGWWMHSLAVTIRISLKRELMSGEVAANASRWATKS
jgi:hypothetical protein